MLHQRGALWRERPPRLRTSTAAPDPRMALRITRVRCLPPYGGVAPAIVIPAGRLGLRRAETA